MGTKSESPYVGCYKRVALAILFVLFTSVSAIAQENGTVSGQVVSTWDGSALPGVVVTIRGTTLATQSDASGRYELKNVPSGDQVLRFSKSGYATVTVTDVRVLLGQTTAVNGNLRPEFYEMEEFEVTAEEFTEQTEQILFERQQSSSMMEAIGSEQFSKLGAGDAAEALSKVTGASVADGKFAVIRGLADRYTSTTMNGVDIPSADPDRKAVQLDLIPSKFIEKIDVSKTFSPDMGGGFAGGSINIVSRGMPEDFEMELEVGTSYNTQASLRDDFLKTDHGKTDWLAMDDGTRKLPAIAAASNPTGQGVINDPAFKNSFKSSQMAPIAGDSPLNSSFSLGMGDSAKVGQGRVGFLAGLSYKNTYEFYDDAFIGQYQSAGEFDSFIKDDAEAVIDYTWSALVSLGWEVNEHHKLGFNFIYVQTATDTARRLQGEDKGISAEGTFLDQSILKWVERNLTYYQVMGNHEFPEAAGMRIDWAAALASTTQDEPDSRIFQFTAEPAAPFFNPDGTIEPTKPFRSWREIQDDVRSARVDLTFPLPSYNEKDNAFKTGLAASDSERQLDQRAFQIPTFPGFGHPFYFSGDPNIYLSPENLQYIYYQNYSHAFNVSGEQTISAWYLMGDWHVLNWLRLTGGVRSESTDLSVTTTDLTRNNEVTQSSIQQTDLLPSLGLTISLRENLLLRAAWSETVIRPIYREISPAQEVDAVRGRVYIGNEDLEFSTSQNYDLRLEWYPRQGSLVAVSAFMKTIEGPIERTAVDTDNEVVTFANFDTADVRGLEFEMRENLGSLWSPLKELSIGFNAAYIQSEVPLTDDQQTVRGELWQDTASKRPLYDQPEFILNGDITWDIALTKTRITLSGGVVGRRLVLVGLAEPDDFEEPAPQLDLFITQRLGEHWKVKFAAKNLLNPVYEVTQDWPTQGPLPVESYTKGMTFGLSIGCEF